MPASALRRAVTAAITRCRRASCAASRPTATAVACRAARTASMMRRS
jgi:hypothetical protein